MTIQERIKQIKERCEKASLGPWGIAYYGNENHPDGYEVGGPTRHICDTKLLQNADFIAQARTDIPWLIERVEKLEGLLFEGKKSCIADCKCNSDLLERVKEALDE